MGLKLGGKQKCTGGDTETHRGGHRNAQARHRNAQGGTQKRTAGDTETHKRGTQKPTICGTDARHKTVGQRLI